MMSDVKTIFGSLRNYQKGGVEVINDDPRNYVFSNVFEVAARSRPFERIAVGRNFDYVIECLRALGTSPWYTAAHDEFALTLDGQVEIRLFKPKAHLLPEDSKGAVAVQDLPDGRPMGRILSGRGHLALLPKGALYQFHAAAPAVVTIQTIKGPVTLERWAEICQTK